MKIGLAQIESRKGNIQENIEKHLNWIDRAIAEKAHLIVFPELSLTGYEPELAKDLAIDRNDSRLEVFQDISDANNIAIAIGVPSRSNSEILISMLFFQPESDRELYSKQILHADELPYFTVGNEQYIHTLKNKKIVPAICYESLQDKHVDNAIALGAEIYLASVAKSQKGTERAYVHFSYTAQKYSIPILMVNSIGLCDTFLGAGQSTVWNKKGRVLGKLKNNKEGLLIYNTTSEEITIIE